MERDGGLKPGELPLLPWAKELMSKRLEKDEPYTACLPMSVPRVNPYPWRFALSYTSRGLTHIYVLHETGDAGAHRVVYMDGRPHPQDPIPTWWGHSIGKFEKDTLVIDTVGYNDKFWFDSRGTPHTEQLHTVERWTRINYGRITNDFLLDDPALDDDSIQRSALALDAMPWLPPVVITRACVLAASSGPASPRLVEACRLLDGLREFHLDKKARIFAAVARGLIAAAEGATGDARRELEHARSIGDPGLAGRVLEARLPSR